MGLSMSYNIARKHGGYLKLESDPGSGTTATVVVPVQRELTSAQ